MTSSGEFSFTTNTLTANDHIITLTVTDEVGAYCRDEVVLFIGSAPTAVITEPSGDVFSVGEDILFHGTTTDVEDSMNELTTSWESSQDGVISTGVPNLQGSNQFFKVNSLTAGLHTLTFAVTDTTGLMGLDTVTFRVNTPPTAPVVSLNPSTVYA